MKIERFARHLLALALAAASAAADYNGASGGNIAITFPTLGASLQSGQSYAITWNSAGITYPLVSIKLLALTNNQPDSNNAIGIADFVQTSSGAYNWMVGQGFAGGNVIEIAGLTSAAYSASFTIIPAAASSSAVNSTMPPSSSSIANLTTTSRPPNSTHISSTLITTAPPSTTLLGTSLSTTSLSSLSTSSANTTDSNSSSPAENPVPYVTVGVVIAVGAVAGAVYVGLRKTRRRRRPVSMPLIVEDSNETQDWSPPDWTNHNNVPSYRRPQPGYSPAVAYSSGANAGYVPPHYYPDPAVPWAAAPSSQTSIPTAVITESGIPAAASVAIPEDVHIREKTAVASPGWEEEAEASARPNSSGSKPDVAD